MNNSIIIEKIANIADNAKNDLSWLAAIHVVLKSSQQNLLPQSKELLEMPETKIKIHNLPPNESRKLQKKTVEIFNKFCDCAIKIPSKGPGHYLNMSAILYVDAIIQTFLDRIFYEIKRQELQVYSIRSKFKVYLDNNIIHYTCLENAKHVLFISGLRHKISHNNGFVDDKFLDKCGIDISTMSLKLGETPLWDEDIWPNEEAFNQSYKLNEYADLSIDTVIIPYLKHSIDFIEEFVDKINDYLKDK